MGVIGYKTLLFEAAWVRRGGGEMERKTRSCCVTIVGGDVLIEPQTMCVFQARGLIGEK